STPPPRDPVATASRIATGTSVAVHALDTRATGLPGRALWWCSALPAHSARPARVAPRETVCGDPVHHPPGPSSVAAGRPTHPASPSTAPGACSSAALTVRGIPGVVARPVPTPGTEISGNRARHGLVPRRSP